MTSNTCSNQSHYFNYKTLHYLSLLLIILTNLILNFADPKKWEAVTTTNFGNMDLTEARQILNLDDINTDDIGSAEVLEERTQLLIKVICQNSLSLY